jgi:transposase-like protein
MPARGPALPETDALRCPYCRSYRIVPLGYLIVTRELFKEAHRCEGCHTTFAVVGPAIV